MLELVKGKPKKLKNDHIRNFISLPLLEAIKEVRCGFELETQNLDGKTWHQLASQYRYHNISGTISQTLFQGIGRIQVKQDCSVKGPEIATCGPLTVKEFIERLKIVTAADFESNASCSFHIHLSIDGVTHRYGQLFQNWIIEYLLMRYESFPEWLKDRFKYKYISENTSWFSRYYAPKLSRDRFAMVAYRGRTWEFRFLGNVNSYEEGLYCLNLAIRALRYAYLVKHQLISPLLRKAVVKRCTRDIMEATSMYLRGGISKNELLSLFAMKTIETAAIEAGNRVGQEELRRAS